MNFKHTKFLLSVLASSPGVLLVHAPLLTVATLLGVATPFATGGLVNALAYRQSPYAPLSILGVLIVVRAVLNPILQRFILSRSRAIETDLQFRVLNATMDRSPAQLATAQNGELVAKFTRDAYAVGEFVRGFYPRLLQTAVMTVASGCALFSRSSVLALAFVALVPLTILLFRPFADQFAKNSHRVRQQCDTSFNTLFDFLLTLPTLRTLNAERRFSDTPKTALAGLKASNEQTDSISVRFGFLFGGLVAVGEVAVIAAATFCAVKGAIPVGDVVLYQMLFMSAVQSVQGVVNLMPELAAIREGADSLGEALGQPPTRSGGVRIEQISELAFERVSFAYPNAADRQVVKDFSARFHANSIVGLTGDNGAGKSTLLKLAINALEPQTGEISVNGHPFAEIDLADFRNRVGIVFQDNQLVTGTVRDNITLRDKKFTESDIQKALALSGFDKTLARFHDGLETRIGNNLRNLSGGERQRLAIARAVIRDPLILVLDEATNHLDAQARTSFKNLLRGLAKGRIIFLVSHDPSLIDLCDEKISCQIPSRLSYMSV